MRQRIRILTLCLFCLAAWGLCGCGNANRDGASGDAGRGDMARESGGAATAQSAAGAVATDIVLSAVEGEAAVSDKNGNHVAQVDGMHLYNGHEVSTQAYSYAYLALDSVKAAKLDQLSSMEVCQAGKDLQLLLGAGEVFFNVEEPLAEDETMNIRTSTMVTGIRGTAGYVKVVDPTRSEIYILEGTVAVTGYEPESGETKTDYATAGQVAVCELYARETGETGGTGDPEGGRVQITIQSFGDGDVPVYVAEEIAADHDLQVRITEANPGSGDGNPGNGSSSGGSLSVEGILSGLEERRQEEAEETGKRLEVAAVRLQDWDGSDTGTADEMFIIENRTTMSMFADNEDAGSFGDSPGSGISGGNREDSGDGSDSQSGMDDSANAPGTNSGVNNSGEDGSAADSGTDDADDKGSADNANTTNLVIIENYENIEINSPTTLNGGDYQSLTVGAGVGNGDVSLNNVNIHGNLTIQGGGENSVHVNNCNVKGTVILDKELSGDAQPVRLVVEGGTQISSVTVKQKAVVEVADVASKVETVHAAADVTISAKHGAKPSVTMLAECPEVKVNEKPILPTEENLPDYCTRHDWGEWVVTEESTCTQRGSKILSCKNCGFSERGYVGEKRHTLKKIGTISGSCESEVGYTLWNCEDCGYQERKDIKTGHRMVSYDTEKATRCKRCGKDAAEVLEELWEKKGAASTLDLNLSEGSEVRIYLSGEKITEPLPGLSVESDPERKYKVNVICTGSLSSRGGITVKEGASLTNEGEWVNDGVITVEPKGEFINRGTLLGSGSMYIKAEGSFTNHGTVTENGIREIKGKFFNYGRVEIPGLRYTNNSPKLEGYFENNGKLAATGEDQSLYILWVKPEGKFVNKGTFTGGASVQGSFVNKGRFEKGRVSVPYGINNDRFYFSGSFELQGTGSSFFSGKLIYGEIKMQLKEGDTFEPDLSSLDGPVHFVVDNEDNLKKISGLMEHLQAEAVEEFKEGCELDRIWKNLRVKVENKDGEPLRIKTDLTLYNTLELPDNTSLTVEKGAILTLGKYPADNYFNDYTINGSIEIGNTARIDNYGELRVPPKEGFKPIDIKEGGCFKNVEGGCVKWICYTEFDYIQGVTDYKKEIAEGISCDGLVVGSSFEIGESDSEDVLYLSGSIYIAEDTVLGVNGSAAVEEGTVIENHGTLIFRDGLENHGKIINYHKIYCNDETGIENQEGGEICKFVKDSEDLKNRLENGGNGKPIIVANYLTYNGTENLTLNGTLEILNGAGLFLDSEITFTISEGSTLEVSKGGIDMVTGASLVNQGTITCKDVYCYDGSIVNNGTVNIYGSVSMHNAFSNGKNGTLNLLSGSVLDCYETLDNAGTIKIEGSFDPEKNLSEQECGRLGLYGGVKNSGSVSGSGMVYFNGDRPAITAEAGSYLYFVKDFGIPWRDPLKPEEIKSVFETFPAEADAVHIYCLVERRTEIIGDLKVDYPLYIDCNVKISGKLTVGENGGIWNSGSEVSCNSLINEGRIQNGKIFTVLGELTNRNTIINSGKFSCGSLVEKGTINGGLEIQSLAAAVGYSLEEPLVEGEPEAGDSPAAEEAEGKEPPETEEPESETEEPPEPGTETGEPPKTEEPGSEAEEPSKTEEPGSETGEPPKMEGPGSETEKPPKTEEPGTETEEPSKTEEPETESKEPSGTEKPGTEG